MSRRGRRRPPVRIRFLRDWQGHRPGTTCEPGGGVADLLIRRGFAELVETETEARVMVPAETATIAKRHKRRKKVSR